MNKGLSVPPGPVGPRVTGVARRSARRSSTRAHHKLFDVQLYMLLITVIHTREGESVRVGLVSGTILPDDPP